MHMEDYVEENAAQDRVISHIFKIKGRSGWSVGIKHRGGHIDIGEGETPLLAMEQATLRADGALGKENRPAPKFDTPKTHAPELPPEPPKKPMSIEDLL